VDGRYRVTDQLSAQKPGGGINQGNRDQDENNDECDLAPSADQHAGHCCINSVWLSGRLILMEPFATVRVQASPVSY
jgi:hypothetical protein